MSKRNRTAEPNFDEATVVFVGGPSHGLIYRAAEDGHRWPAKVEVEGIYEPGMFAYRYATMSMSVDAVDSAVRTDGEVNRFSVSFYAFAKADPAAVSKYVVSHVEVIDGISRDNATPDGLGLNPLATAMEMYKLSVEFEIALMGVDPLRGRRHPGGVWRLREDWNRALDADEKLLRAIGAGGYLGSSQRG